MKQRLAFTTDNTRGLTAAQLETVNRGYDLWYDSNKFHGKDFKAWQIRSEHAKGRIIQMALQVARDSETVDPPDPDADAVQPLAGLPISPPRVDPPAPWPPEDGSTGSGEVDPNSLEPIPGTLPVAG